MSKDYWNKIYNNIESSGSDDWLDKYSVMLQSTNNIPILDIGCGLGNDTLYLLNRGFNVISCDFSEKALNKLMSLNSNVKTKCFNIKDGLPFEDKSVNIIISDLSLHYFPWVETEYILTEFYRVLDNNGKIFCRVNSTKDINYGAGIGLEIEENFYINNGNSKRFFDKNQIYQLFKNWTIKNIVETSISRYGSDKIIWDLAICK